MKVEKIKKLSIDAIIALVGVSFPVCTICASWVILHEMANIVMDMYHQLDLVVMVTVLTAVVLIWLNSLILDGTMWVLARIDKD
jgi:hypothetical protein